MARAGPAGTQVLPAGIAPAGPLAELEHFPAWIAAGFHGEMDYLAKTNQAGQLRRAALANVAPWARSVVICSANYNSDVPYSTGCADPLRGWISRYAFVERDYHDVVLARLRRVEQRLVERLAAAGEPAPRSWCYVDTGPVIERVLAQHSGIGWIGSFRDGIRASLGAEGSPGNLLTDKLRDLLAVGEAAAPLGSLSDALQDAVQAPVGRVREPEAEVDVRFLADSRRALFVDTGDFDVADAFHISVFPRFGACWSVGRMV